MNPHVYSQSYRVPRPFASGNWGGLSVIGDRVLFGLCSHRVDEHVRLCVYQQSHGTITELEQLDNILAADAGSIAHGKIHTPFRVVGRRAYFGTHLGYYGSDRRGLKRYRGGRLISLALDDMHLEDLGVLWPGEGIIGLEADEEREQLYAFTWPSADLVQYDIETRSIRHLGTFRRSHTSDTCCRSPVFVDGYLVFCTADGAIHAWDRDEDRFKCLPKEMHSVVLEAALHNRWALPRGITLKSSADIAAIAARFKSQPGWGLLWHPATRDPHHPAALVLTNTSSCLLRVFPRGGRVEYVDQLCIRSNREKYDIGTSISLTLTHAPAQRLYHIGTELFGDSRDPQIRAHLLHYDLTDRKYHDYGRIRTDDDLEVLYLQTLGHFADGRLVSVGLVDLPENKHAEFFATCPAKVDVGISAQKNPYEMRLLIIDPRLARSESLGRTPGG